MLVLGALLLSMGHTILCGEPYSFSLFIRDALHSEWVEEETTLVTRTECAALCYQRGGCRHFGFNISHCFLLKDYLEGCEEDECPESPGMKIYQVRALPTLTMHIAMPLWRFI
ncbi:uncharacterized protein CDAR_411221 [Caerostris darwini]|uniref:Apple domain-containing protein n=1 Tax=Caerostris darwini TaxID=1538125 RepID=A0AAV4SFR3_9ARAC|nr:uncharacterized protein CDAR_411221 [Caerostris darwini]